MTGVQFLQIFVCQTAEARFAAVEKLRKCPMNGIGQPRFCHDDIGVQGVFGVQEIAQPEFQISANGRKKNQQTKKEQRRENEKKGTKGQGGTKTAKYLPLPGPTCTLSLPLVWSSSSD